MAKSYDANFLKQVAEQLVKIYPDYEKKEMRADLPEEVVTLLGEDVVKIFLTISIDQVNRKKINPALSKLIKKELNCEEFAKVLSDCKPADVVEADSVGKKIKYCEKCKKNYEDKLIYCSIHGTKLVEKPLEMVCPGCKKTVESGTKFCPFCNAKIELNWLDKLWKGKETKKLEDTEEKPQKTPEEMIKEEYEATLQYQKSSLEKMDEIIKLLQSIDTNIKKIKPAAAKTPKSDFGS